MVSNISNRTTRRRWAIVSLAAVGVLVAAWGFFHPEFRPDASTIAPAIREGLAKTGFVQTRGVTSARLETVEAVGAMRESSTLEQKIVPIDGLLTEKRSRQRTKGHSEEYSGLYVGPIVVVRHYRTRPPIVGDLLPYQFWKSSRLSEFIVEETDRFPHAKGGKLRARVSYEDRYAGGELAQTERRRLHCDVLDVVDAASINSALSGAAARIECREELEPNGRQVGATNPQTYSMGRLTQSHWYIFNRGWSIPIEGERAMRIGDTDVVRSWNVKLVSFESSGI
jgi:hypothetical protein